MRATLPSSEQSINEGIMAISRLPTSMRQILASVTCTVISSGSKGSFQVTSFGARSAAASGRDLGQRNQIRWIQKKHSRFPMRWQIFKIATTDSDHVGIGSTF